MHSWLATLQHDVQHESSHSTAGDCPANSKQSEYKETKDFLELERRSQMESGIIPVNRFQCNHNSSRLAKLESSSGILPSNRFCFKRSDFSSRRFPTFAGRVPENLLTDASKNVNSFSSNISEGNVPENLLLLIRSSRSFVRLLNPTGMPVNSLYSA